MEASHFRFFGEFAVTVARRVMKIFGGKRTELCTCSEKKGDSKDEQRGEGRRSIVLRCDNIRGWDD